VSSGREAADDGVVFEAHVLDVGADTRILEEQLPPGAADRVVERPLGRWANRDVVLRLLELRGDEASEDERSGFRRPRIGPCECTVDLLEALRMGRVDQQRGSPTAREFGIFLHPTPPGDPPAEVVFPIRACSDSCLAVELHLGARAGQGDGVTYEADILDDSGSHEILHRHLAPGATSVRTELPLDRWAGRELRLRLATLPGETADYDWASFAAPAVRPCSGSLVRTDPE